MSSRMWEVDPETRTKLLAISKVNGNDKCCDCGAPSPQWASPKFGTFICLNCAGTHRGLGVHISFVRSITMDAFKHAEIQRMEHGGNEPWKSFFDAHPVTVSEGRTFEDSTIKERYEGEVGEEWKERLAAKVEGREYVPGLGKKKQESRSGSGSAGGMTPRSGTPSGTSVAGGGAGGGLGSGRASPSVRAGGRDAQNNTQSSSIGRKEHNEAYFARLGTENASRPDNLPPSQGGKYAGFGGGLPTPSSTGGGSSGGKDVPNFDEFQKDPVAALTKGFGWFTSAVGRSAKTVTETYIQPTAKSIAESDFAAHARIQASQLGQNLQAGARGAADSFNRFVEGPDAARFGAGEVARGAAGLRHHEPERKDFWDDFSSIRASQESVRKGGTPSASGAIGTAAMRTSTSMNVSGGAMTATGTAAAPAATAKQKVQDESGNGGWDDNW